MIGFLHPAGAMALAAGAVLVALYLVERRRRVIPVTTLFLWRQLPPSPVERRRRFRPDLLFVLQLLLLLALIGAHLRPYVDTSAVRAGTAAPLAAPLIVVLDASASMQAREAEGTRFELVRRRVRALTRERTGETMLVVAAERPHVVLRWTGDPALVGRRLEIIAPLDVGTNLAPAVALALGEMRARPGTRAAVFTDLAREASGVPPGDLAAVDYVQVGRTDDNLAVVSLTVDTPSFRRAAATATVVVRNYAHRTRRTALEARVGGALWTRREIVLAPRGAEPVLLTGPPDAGELTVTLVGGDALEVDDTARSWIAPGVPLDLQVVTESREVAAAVRALARAMPGSRVEVLPPARWAGGGHPGVVLFDRFVPAGAPAAVNALYVAPPPGNTLCPVADATDAAAVVDWEPEHPALAGLEGLQALEVARAREVLTPDWATPVVRAVSRRGTFPLLVAGERDGRRIACLGAELDTPLVTSDRLPLLVLTLGTLRWLQAAEGAAPLVVQTGVAVRAGDGPTAPVRGEGLRVAGDPAVLLAERAGTYRLGPPGAERLVLANLLDDRESDIGRSGGGAWPATVTLPTPVASRSTRELTWWLSLAAAALLALEWAVWCRRRA